MAHVFVLHLLKTLLRSAATSSQFFLPAHWRNPTPNLPFRNSANFFIKLSSWELLTYSCRIKFPQNNNINRKYGLCIYKATDACTSSTGCALSWIAKMCVMLFFVNWSMSLASEKIEIKICKIINTSLYSATHNSNYFLNNIREKITRLWMADEQCNDFHNIHVHEKITWLWMAAVQCSVTPVEITHRIM